MIDGLIEIFNTLFGFNITSNNEEIDILQFLLNDSKLLMIFTTIFIITIFICLIITIYSIIKNMAQNNKNITTILSKFFISIISIMIVLIILLIIVSISNILLKLLLDILNIDYSLNISKLILNNSIGNFLFDYSINEINISTITPNKLLGDYIIQEGLIIPLEWKKNGMINPNNFYYLPSLITSILVLTSLIITVINVIKRIYKIVLLYITLPISLSTLPLDNGKTFDIWKNNLISEIFIIFIIVLSLNIYSIILPILLNINIETNISSYGKSLINLLIIASGSIFILSAQKLFNNKKEKENENNT